jgi:hypothetical protein
MSFLFRKFFKCSKQVKISLLTAFCVNFYGISVWRLDNGTVLQKLQAAYVKYIKTFFGFDLHDKIVDMFIDLGLPTFAPIKLNA